MDQRLVTGPKAASEIPEFIVRHTTMRQLQIFEAIVRNGSFTRAAEELFLTQPTVSMQTKKLTDAFGLPLLTQMGRRVRPTEAGEIVYSTIREMFDSLNNLDAALAEIQGLKRGRLRLAVVSTAKYVAPELLGKFNDLYPNIELSLKVSNRDRVLERMSSHEDDLYIMGQVAHEFEDVEVYPFAPNPLVVVAPKDHDLRQRSQISLQELAETSFILREPGSGTRDATLKVFEKANIRPRIKMELGSSEAIKHAVLAGLGLSVLSLHSMTLEGPQGPLALLDVNGFPIMRQWFIVHPKGRSLSLVAQSFLEFAISEEQTMRDAMANQWPLVFQNAD
jgi:DNA-binding transcriptional LysR family regulator